MVIRFLLRRKLRVKITRTDKTADTIKASTERVKNSEKSINQSKRRKLKSL